MRQIWTNCHLYNKKETEIDRVGRRAEQFFQEKWNRSGFAAADARAKRNNAGVAAPKYEPNEYGPPEKKLQRRPSGSKNGRTTVRKVSRVTYSMFLSGYICSVIKSVNGVAQKFIYSCSINIWLHQDCFQSISNWHQF